MSTISNNFSDVGNLDLNDSLGIQFSVRSSDPTDSNLAQGRIYYNSTSTAFKVYDGSIWTVIGEAGSVATTWEQIYNNDKTLAITASTWTITQSSNNPIFTLNKTGSGSGAVIDITNGGSGDDITGNSDNWSVTKAGLATFATNSVVSGVLKLGTGAATGTLQSNGNFNLILQTGNATTATIEIIDASNGDVDITLDGTGAVNINGTTEGNDSLVVAAGDVAVTLGSFTLADNDNANSMTVTNNTVTDASVTTGGVVEFQSTSLTTGALLNLELTESNLSGGQYLRCFDVTAAGDVFTVSEDGNTAITGVDGSTMFTITAGDAVFSEGSLAVTDSDNAATFTVTNNTATSASVLVYAGSGTFTGNTTSSFMTLTPSGLTTGTGLYFPLVAMNSGTGLHMIANAMTTGSAVFLTSTGTLVDAGKMLEIVADSATTPGASAGEGIVAISADGLTTGTALDVTSTSSALAAGQLAHFAHIASASSLTAKSAEAVFIELDRTETRTSGTTADNYDGLSVKRTSIMNGAGGALTAAGAVIKVENVATQSNGTLTDTVNGIEIVMDVDGTGDAINIVHSAIAGRLLDMTSSATTLDGVIQVTANSVNSGNVMVVDANGLTTGTVLALETTGTVVTTGDVLSIVANSATTATGLLRISGTGLTNGFAMEVTGGGANATASGGVLNILAGAATVGNVVQMSTTGVYTGTGVLEVTANSATTGDLVVVSGTSLTTGNCLLVTGGGAAITASGQVVDVVMGAATVGVGVRIATTGVYTGSTGILDINAASATSGTIVSIGVAALTTGTALDIGDLDSLTTGKGLDIVSNSSDTGAFNLLNLHVDHASAIGAVALQITSDAVIETNFAVVADFNGTTIFTGDGSTNPEGALTGVQGDLCLSGDSGKIYFCDANGKNWTQM